MAALGLFGIVALAGIFWLVEVVRAKVGHRLPSWKQPHEAPPANSLSNAFWGRGIYVPPPIRRKPKPDDGSATAADEPDRDRP